MSDATTTTESVAELRLVLHRAEHQLEVQRWQLCFAVPAGAITEDEAMAAVDDAERQVAAARAALERPA